MWTWGWFSEPGKKCGRKCERERERERGGEERRTNKWRMMKDKYLEAKRARAKQFGERGRKGGREKERKRERYISKGTRGWKLHELQENKEGSKEVMKGGPDEVREGEGARGTGGVLMLILQR